MLFLKKELRLILIKYQLLWIGLNFNQSKSLHGFLELTSYYRKFIKDYGKISSPLTKPLKKDSFSWNLVAEMAFEQLKMAMTRNPVLALLEFSKTFTVECGSSGLGVGGVLRQERPIDFFSHAL